MTTRIRPRNRIAAGVILSLAGLILCAVVLGFYPVLTYRLMIPVAVFAIIVTMSRSYRSIVDQLVAVRTQVQSAEEMATSAALEIAELRAELAQKGETETRVAGFRIPSETATAQAEPRTHVAHAFTHQCDGGSDQLSST